MCYENLIKQLTNHLRVKEAREDLKYGSSAVVLLPYRHTEVLYCLEGKNYAQSLSRTR